MAFQFCPGFEVVFRLHKEIEACFCFIKTIWFLKCSHLFVNHYCLIVKLELNPTEAGTSYSV